jgi:type III pantothenate kinase
MKLLIDIGNTRLKWAFARDGEFVANGAIVHDGEPARIVSHLPAATIEEVWISHVTGAMHEAALNDAVLTHFVTPARYARTTAEWHGLKNAYREPERLGIDRWLAMIAAWHAKQGSACIVDAGTALTVDALNEHGQHLGGIIMAGLEAQQRAVLGTTRFATRSLNATYGGHFGYDTESCVRQGAMFACLGAIEHASALAGITENCLLTGGDATLLLSHLSSRSWQHRPLLVLEGLLAVSLS